MSFEVNSTRSTSSAELYEADSVHDNKPCFFSLHKFIDKYFALLEDVNSREYDNPDDYETDRQEVRDKIAFLYLNDIEFHCNELKGEITSYSPQGSLANNGYLKSINELRDKQFALAHNLEIFFNEHLEKIRKKITGEAAEKFKETITEGINTKIAEVKVCYREQIDYLVEKALKDFYNSTLDSHPELYPELGGSSRETMAQHYSQDICSFLRDNNGLDEKCKKVLIDCSSKLISAYCLEINRKESCKRSNELLAAHAKTMEVLIKSLKVGESCLILGGTAAHAVIYEVIRKSQDCCEFTIINTGEDENHAEMRKPNNIASLFSADNQYCHKSYLIDPTAFDSVFLLKLIEPLQEYKAMADVIGEIDKDLMAKKAERQLGRLHHFQERGSCSAKSVASWIKGELIRQLGPEKGKALYLQLKQFRAENNFKAIIKLEEEVPKEHFKMAYSERKYKPRKSPYEKKELTKKIPATELQLSRSLKDLHNASTNVIQSWDKKAKAAKAKLAKS